MSTQDGSWASQLQKSMPQARLSVKQAPTDSVWDRQQSQPLTLEMSDQRS